MTKSIALLLIPAVLLCVSSVRAQEDGEEAPTEDARATAPVHRAAGKAFNAPRPRPAAPAAGGDSVEPSTESENAPGSGGGDSSSAISGGGSSLGDRGIGTGKADSAPGTAKSNSPSGEGGGSSGGVSCEKSDPKLSAVHRREIDLKAFSQTDGFVRYELRSGEALSVKFKTPHSGFGFFTTGDSTSAREVANLMTISQTPCDFDAAKAAKKDPCHVQMIHGAEVRFQIAPAQKGIGWGGCILKPDSVYYMNIRNLTSPVEGVASFDSCDDWHGTGVKPCCGGWWQFRHGDLKWTDGDAKPGNPDGGRTAATLMCR